MRYQFEIGIKNHSNCHQPDCLRKVSSIYIDGSLADFQDNSGGYIATEVWPRVGRWILPKTARVDGRANRNDGCSTNDLT